MNRLVSANVPSASRFPVGQEDRSEPTEEDGERQHPDRQHRHGHGQDQGGGLEPAAREPMSPHELNLRCFSKPASCLLADLWLEGPRGLHREGR